MMAPVGVEYLSTRVSQDRRTVQRTLRKLQETQHVSVARPATPSTPAVYRINLALVTGGEGRQDAAPPGGTTPPPGRQDAAPPDRSHLVVELPLQETTETTTTAGPVTQAAPATPPKRARSPKHAVLTLNGALEEYAIRPGLALLNVPETLGDRK